MTEVTEGLSNVQLHLVDNTETAAAFLRWAGERRPFDAIAVDIETGELPGNPTKDALSPWKGQIRLVQVGDAEQGWAIPWDEWKGVFYQMITDYRGPIICHNIAFEAKWFALHSRWVLPWHQAHDTMLMSQIVNPLEPAALKRLAARYIDPQAVAMQDSLNNTFAENGWTWGTVPVNFEAYWLYGALDCILTTRLWLKYWETCQPGAIYSIPYELEMATRKIATRMELNGARVDLDYSQKQLDMLTSYTDSVKSWAKQKYSGTSITSNVQLVRLFEKMGAEITETTPSGQKSMTKEQLQMLQRDGNSEIQVLAEAVLKQRQADKLASSYFSNFISDNIDGFVHPSIRTMGARTGRMSITGPALQTLPSGDAVVRNAFIPKQDGWGIISSDLDQVEFRLTANLSEDPKLIALFHASDKVGGDVFTEIMKDVYQDNSLVKADPRRKLIKGCVPLDSEILTRRGWLTHDQVVVGDETVGYNLETGKSEWTAVEGVHTFEDSDIYKLSNAHKEFLCTADHRWIADNSRSGVRGRKPKIIHANEFIGGEKRLILAAEAEDGSLSISDEEAYFLGWVLGDGAIRRSAITGKTSQAGGTKVGCEVKIYQTKPDMVKVIDEMSKKFSHTRKVNPRTGQVVWSYSPVEMRNLLPRAGVQDKHNFAPWDLAAGLSLSARKEMIRALDQADGKNKTAQGTRTKIDVAIVQAADSSVAELVIALGFLTGQFSRSTTYTEDIENPDKWQKNPIKVIRHQVGTMTNRRASLQYVETGSVWCVTTGLGTWTMRQKDNVPVLTGNTIYGKLYGAGVDKMALTSGVSSEQMRSVVNAFDKSYPGVKMLQRKVEDGGMRRLRDEGQGYVSTRTGRRLPCDDDRVYSLTNYLIQGSSSEIFKQCLVKLDQQDLGEHLIVPVHDEIVLQAPVEDAPDIKQIVKECMTTKDGWNVPLTAGVDGPFQRWGESYEK